MELGVDMIELDVQLTADRRLVVLHDRQLGRTIEGRGAVRDRSLAEIVALDAGAWFAPEYAGLRAPSLDEVLELTEGRVQLNVEIKSPADDWAPTAAALVDLLRRHHRLASTIVSSFEIGALRAVRRAEPHAALGVLWQSAELEGMWAAAAELGAVSVHPHWMLADAALVAAARRRGLRVFVWTVNEPADIDRLAALGVDGIISDFPERLAGGRGGGA